MTELFEVIGDPIKEEDRVAHLLASLPESFNMLVTTLEASIPSMNQGWGQIHEYLYLCCI